MLVTQWNSQYKILVDEQGIMIPRSSLMWLKKQIEEHLSHSALELEALGRRTVVDNHPTMVDQFNWGWFE